MQPLPNGAETALATAIAKQGSTGFVAALLAFLARALAFDNILILAYAKTARPQVLFRQSANPLVFAEIDATYLAGAYLLDPFHDLHLSQAPAGLYRLRDIAPDQFARSRYFQDYYQRSTLLDELTFIAYPTQGLTLNLCAGRDASSQVPFSAREAAIASRIAPIVTALMARHWSGDALSSPGPAADPAAGPDAGPDATAHLIRAARARHGIALSRRQAEVALLILRGHSSPSIGLRLGLSAQTIKVYRRQLYARCGRSSQAELFAMMLPLLNAQG